MVSFGGRYNFRDRPLKPGEKSHLYCPKCGKDIMPDSIHSHKCKTYKSKYIQI